MAQKAPNRNPQLSRGGATASGKRRLAIRDSFIRETGPALIKARQHRAFKMYLFCLWSCYPYGRPRLSHHLENKQIGALLGIGTTADSRASSISHVLATLEEFNLIRRIRDGEKRSIVVLHESRNGAEYTQPKGGGQNSYVELPSDFFTHGWLSTLSAPAILVMLMALREQRFLTYRRTKTKGWDSSFDWFQPVSKLTKNYGLGKTTIEKGIRELKACGFLTSRLTARHPLYRSLVKPRNLYSNHLSVFKTEAAAQVH